MSIKFLLLLACFMLPFTEHEYCSKRVFYARHRIKYGNGMRIFLAIFKEIFLRCDVTRLLGVMVMLLAFKTFNLASVFTKINALNLYASAVNFFAINFGIYCLEIYKVSKSRPKVLD